MGIKRGFTLVELLVVVTILATVGVLATNMFFQILKGASKTEVLKRVKQEGNYALSVIEKMSRNALEVEDMKSVCDGNYRSSLTIKNQDEATTSFSCTGTTIASNSADLTSSQVRVSSDCNQFIKCTQTGSAPAVVEIKFSLSQAGSPTRPEEKASVDFQTTVSLRNY